MLKLKNVSKKFGGLPALSDVSFAVERNKITALIGPNGAGKSTLVDCISGVNEPGSGSIMFKNIEIAGLPAHQTAMLGLSRTFQNPRVFPKMSVLKNVLCGLTVKANHSFLAAMLKPPSIRHQERALHLKAKDMLDLFGLAGKADNPGAMLSYGDKKRVEMARAFVSNPRLVLLDEPVAGLNPEETSEIALLIQKMKQSGHTILLIEHDMELVMKISDRVIVIDSGQLIAQGTPAEIQINPLVLEAYLGKISETA